MKFSREITTTMFLGFETLRITCTVILEICRYSVSKVLEFELLFENQNLRNR